jgi:hypothetical protein
MVLSVVLLALALYTYLAWSAPYRAARAFVRAVEQRDAEAIVALSYPSETETNLTPRTVQFALDRILPTQVRRDSDLIPSAMAPGGGWRGPAQRTTLMEGTICRWKVRWVDARTGKPLPGRGPEGRLVSDIFVKPSDRGWRVLVGQFLWDTCRYRYGIGPDGTAAFAAIASQAGITGRINTEGRRRLPDGSRAPSQE